MNVKNPEFRKLLGFSEIGEKALFWKFCLPSESDVLTAFNFVSLLQVDAHAEECFFDKVTAGSKLGLMFQVAEGGFLDIDVRIEGPDGRYGNARIIVVTHI